MKDIIKKAVRQVKDNGYKPTAIWITKDNVYVVTDDIDRSKYAKLLKKFKK
jgi:hypothetical protein